MQATLAKKCVNNYSRCTSHVQMQLTTSICAVWCYCDVWFLDQVTTKGQRNSLRGETQRVENLLYNGRAATLFNRKKIIGDALVLCVYGTCFNGLYTCVFVSPPPHQRNFFSFYFCFGWWMKGNVNIWYNGNIWYNLNNSFRCSCMITQL
jgi:hypothetical protein